MFAQLLFLFLNVIPLGFCLTSLFFQKSLQVRPGPPPTGRPKKNLWGFLTSRMPALPHPTVPVSEQHVITEVNLADKDSLKVCSPTSEGREATVVALLVRNSAQHQSLCVSRPKTNMIRT